MNIERQIKHWADGTHRSWRAVPILREAGYYAEALFYAHLAVEKALKAHVVKSTEAIPPYIHNLPRLLKLSGMEPDAETLRVCESLTKYQSLTRYGTSGEEGEPEPEVALALLEDAERLWKWFLEQL